MTDNLLDNLDDNSNATNINNYLEVLVGDNKKFKDVEALARGKYESDSYVKILETRLDELREDYIKVREENVAKAKLQEYIDQMNTRRDSSNSDLTLDAKDVNKPSMDAKQIKELVSSALQEQETTRKQQDNINLVTSKLREQFGEKADSVLRDQMKELGLAPETVKELAMNHPTVLIKTLGLDQAAPTNPFQSPPRSSQRNDNFSPTTQKRTWDYYQKLKKENPKVYFDPKIAVQMQKDAAELGPAFEDGDFHRFTNNQITTRFG